MRQDEIAQYTDDKNVLEMQDFSAMPEDERLEDDAYIEAQAIIAGKIHNALRAAGNGETSWEGEPSELPYLFTGCVVQ